MTKFEEDRTKANQSRGESLIANLTFFSKRETQI